MESFENMCRFCLKSLYDSSRVNIFDEENMRRNTVDKIMSCLSLIVSEDDTLPNFICFPCAEKLDSFQDFRDTCHKSESFLIKLSSMKDVSLSGTSKAQNAQSGRSRKSTNTHDFPPEPQQVFVKVENQDPRFDDLLSNSEIPSSSLNTVQEGTFPGGSAYETPLGLEIRRVRQKEPVFSQGGGGGPVVKTEVNMTESYPEQAGCDMDSAFPLAGNEDDTSAANDDFPDSDMYGGSANVSNVQGEDDEEDIILLSDDSDTESASKVPKRAKTSFGESGSRSRGSMPGTSQESSVPRSNPVVLDETLLTALMNESSPTKTHVCSWCSKMFYSSYDLKLHERKHTGERPYACHSCTRCFSQKGNWKRHLKLHSTPEKPFCCDECGRNYSTEDKLKAHKLIHLAVRAQKPN